MICISDNWIVNILENALTDWNGKLSEIWTLLTQTPQSFKGGDIWTAVSGIHTAMVGVGYGLLVLFFAMGIFQSAASFRDFQRPEFALRHFIRFILAKVAVGSCMEIMTAIFSVCGGVVATVMSGMGGSVSTAATLPTEIVTAIEDCGFFESIPLWAVTLIGGLLIWVLSFVMILSVYGRFFKMYMYAALAPIPLSSFAGEPSQNVGKSFLKSYAAVCLEGAVIVLACIIFSVFASAPPTVDPDAAAASMVWSYIGEVVFNMLILVGSVKMSDHVVREMMGL